MVLVTLLIGTDASIDAVEMLTVDEGVVAEDEEEDEDGLDMEGGPEPTVLLEDWIWKCWSYLRQLFKARWWEWRCFGRELEVGRWSRQC